MLDTPWSRSLRLRTPILNAPMGGVAGGRLAKAVSGAGGLGMIGVGTTTSAGVIEREAAIVRATGLPFGVGLIGWRLADEPALLDTALEAQPALVSIGFGDVAPWVARVHDAGALITTQVYDVEGARAAEAAGVDVIVARGAEGGGHGRNEVSTLALLARVLDVVEVPVLAAGAVASARGLAAVLACGASGAWIGTAFLLCPEALTAPSTYDRIIAAAETDTVYTTSVDVALGYPWPARFGERVLRNRFTERWADRAERLGADETARADFARARAAGDPDVLEIDAGQGVGLLTRVQSAAAVVEDLSHGARSLLDHWTPVNE